MTVVTVFPSGENCLGFFLLCRILSAEERYKPAFYVLKKII